MINIIKCQEKIRFQQYLMAMRFRIQIKVNKYLIWLSTLNIFVSTSLRRAFMLHKAS